MLIRFWGVRGSLPSPILPSGIKAKISAILEQAVPEDFASAESRERFLESLPPWLCGTVGGNTPCVSVEIEGCPEPIIFDCGSGIREMGIACAAKKPAHEQYHIFVSHFHWDHLLGFPFFGPAYSPSVAMDFYSPHPGFEEYFRGIMKMPYFPVQMENLASKKKFHPMEGTLSIGPATIDFKKLSHPGDSYSFKISHNGKRFIYATDTELSAADFLPSGENAAFFKDADAIVLDSQYTLGEAIVKNNWGHSAFSLSVDFAANWGIKHLVLFHHEPTYDDQKLYGILQAAQWYLQRMDGKKMEISLATEGLEISL
ncbi:MAG: MBL fold metallo-hydrolase [Treponema sp.]|jgi:phosphoribosyl 1,2-cyclic phosphodiesterase|nr:MBL fold metallo-hydrolase [Treponema sp.]